MIPLRATIGPLFSAPIASLPMIAILQTFQLRSLEGLVYGVIAIPFVYAVVLLFVLPILWLVPRSRVPTFGAAALWGALTALVPFAILAIPNNPFLGTWRATLGATLGATLWAVWCGSPGGLLYARLIHDKLNRPS
jgi:hypothetical protein